MSESSRDINYLLNEKTVPVHRAVEVGIQGFPGAYNERDRRLLKLSLRAQGIAIGLAGQMVDLMVKGLNLYVDNGKPALFTGSVDQKIVEQALSDSAITDAGLRKLLEDSLRGNKSTNVESPTEGQ